MKDEHKTFLVKALIPLHKPKNINAFQQQLSYCVTQFVEKDAALAETVILGLLQYWPATNSAKSVLYLGGARQSRFLFLQQVYAASM